jgi:hypothetical protein
MSNLQKRVLVVRGKHGSHRQTFWIANELPKEQRTLRFADGERVKPRNEVVDPKDRVTVRYGMLFSKRANEGVDHALSAIGKVHSVPKELHKIPVEVQGSLGGANGMYTLWRPSGEHNKIMVSKWCSQPAATIAHEYGHFLDHHLLGTGKPTIHAMASVQWAKKEPGGKEIGPVMRALYRSQAGKSLVAKHEENIRTDNHYGKQASEYLLMPPEMFARAYNQYIGLRGSERIARETREHGEGWSRYGYQAQWTDADFAPIAREFDRLFQRRGLLRHRRAE